MSLTVVPDAVFGRFRIYKLTARFPLSLGYGLGPLLFSPISEIPAIGRNLPYVVTFILFMIVTVPTALVRNASAFMFLRFLQGFLGSPILATGGASLADMYDNSSLAYAIISWTGATFVAPAIG